MKMTMTATGDSLIIQGYPDGGYEGFSQIHDYIAKGQARFSNLETNLTDSGTWGSAFSGGTWVTTEPRILRDVLAYGFNFLGFANNHTLDYGIPGMLETLSNIKKTGTAVAGAGKNLFEAGNPVYRDFPGGRVAFISVSSTFDDSARAGFPSHSMEGRPGVNPLRHSTTMLVNEEHFAAINEIAKATKINASADISRKNGFRPPLAEGTTALGSLSVKLSPDGSEKMQTKCNKHDLARILSNIRDAKNIADYIVVMLHAHEMTGDAICYPADFVEEFAHAIIDGGADVMFGGGAHEIRPIEIYNGKPIFYSLGNFVFQSNVVERQPYEVIEKYDLPKDTSDIMMLDMRNHGWTIGHHKDPNNFKSYIPLVEFQDGRLCSVELMPIELGFDKCRTQKGLPYPANERYTKEIFDTLNRLSEPYGTKMELCGSVIKIKV